MTDVGDRIEVLSKDAPRFGVVTAASGALITVRWDTGGETDLIPGPGVIRVLTAVSKAPVSKTAAKKVSPAKRTPATKVPTKKKVAAKKPAAKKVAKKTPTKRAATKR